MIERKSISVVTHPCAAGLDPAARSKRPLRRTTASRRGTTMLEMAVVVPVVLFLLLGLADLSIAVYSYNTVAEAARAGTRYGQVHGAKSSKPAGPTANDSEVEKAVKGYTPGMITSALTVSSSWPDGDNAPGSRVTVAVKYAYKPAVTWVLGVKDINVSSTSTMTITH